MQIQSILPSLALAIFAAGPLLASTAVFSLGTSAPPSSLRPLQWVPFPFDPTPEFEPVTSVASPLGGNLLFSQPLDLLFVPNSWGSWSHDYEGDVYATAGSLFSVTIKFPPGTGAFAFYAQPADLVIQSFSVSESSGPALVVSIDGDGGASGFLSVFRSGSREVLNEMTLVTSGGFAVGEFYIAAVPEGEAGWAAIALMGACGLAWRRRKV